MPSHPTKTQNKSVISSIKNSSLFFKMLGIKQVLGRTYNVCFTSNVLIYVARIIRTVNQSLNPGLAFSQHSQLPHKGSNL
jgi:hypothetical protein